MLNGKNIGSALTASNGVAVISLTAKILKVAKYGKKNLVISFEDSNYNKVTKTVKIIINKEKTKLVGKNAKFRKSKKTKKYSVILKNSKGKAIKKVYVTLRSRAKPIRQKPIQREKPHLRLKN